MRDGETITTDDLVNEWKGVLSTYDLMIDNGIKLRPIRFIIRNIIEKGYDRLLFPGTSLYSLLISIPIDKKVNYSKTLKIEYDQLIEELKFKFIDRTAQDQQDLNSKGKVLWDVTCQATEGSSVIESFFMDNEDFRKTVEKRMSVG
ncbi:MAG: hypothetical protein ABI851_15390 [Saprospiraceae bacterium]